MTDGVHWVETFHGFGPEWMAHLWDNVAVFVAVALLEHWGVTAQAWLNDDDHTLGWLADAP